MDWLISTELGQIVLLLLGLMAAKVLTRRFLIDLVRRSIRSHNFDSVESEKKREDTVINIVGTAVTVMLIIVGIIGLLAILHVNIIGLLTGAGVIGVIVGLGGQNIIKDFLAGVFILIENQYRVGDIITLGSVSGVVEKINLRITKLRDLDGNVHIIPNGAVVVVTNRTFGYSNVNIDIGVSYDSDVDKVRRIMDETGQQMANDTDWQELIIEPIGFLRVENFGDSSVDIKVLGRVVPGKQWDAAGEYRDRIKKAFHKHGIEIPFPQRVIHQPAKKAAPKN